MDFYSPFNVIRRAWVKIPRHSRIQICSAFLIGLLVHMYLLTNGFFNHDGVMIYDFLRDQYIATGRWFSIVPDMLLGNYNVKWLNSLFALVYLSIAAGLIGACLEIRRTPLVLLLSALLVTFPAVGLAFSYNYYTDNFFLSVLLASLAVYLVKRFRFGFLFGAIPLFLSMAIYQAYIGLYAGIMVLILIKGVLNNTDSKECIKSFFKYAVAFIIGFGAYLLSLQPAAGNMMYYAGYNEIGNFSFTDLPERILFSYTNFFEIFFRNAYQIHHGFHINYLTPVSIFQYLFLAAALLSFVLLVVIILNRKIYKKLSSSILLLIFIILFPPACNLISIISPEHLYIMMQYSLVLFFVLILILIDISVSSVENSTSKTRPKIVYFSSWALLLFCCILVLNYTVYTNTHYLKMEIILEQGRAFSTELVTRIKSEDFYSSEKAVVFFGRPPDNWTLRQFIDMDAVPSGGGNFLIHPYFPEFLHNYIGFNNVIFYYYFYQEPYSIHANPDAIQFAMEMPSFPAQGSIAQFDEFIFVKFSDWD